MFLQPNLAKCARVPQRAQIVHEIMRLSDSFKKTATDHYFSQNRTAAQKFHLSLKDRCALTIHGQRVSRINRDWAEAVPLIFKFTGRNDFYRLR
jgi:hypothetical protein